MPQNISIYINVKSVVLLLAAGLEIGSHTANHVDLGCCPVDEARIEIRECVEDLQRMTGREITLFSYPFGKERNIRRELINVVREAGCECMFSAFGGFVGARTDLFDLFSVWRPTRLIVCFAPLAPVTSIEAPSAERPPQRGSASSVDQS